MKTAEPAALIKNAAVLIAVTAVVVFWIGGFIVIIGKALSHSGPIWYISAALYVLGSGVAAAIMFKKS